MADEDCFTEQYDVLDEQGLANDSAAWAAIERVREELAAYGRRTGKRAQ